MVVFVYANGLLLLILTVLLLQLLHSHWPYVLVQVFPTIAALVEQFDDEVGNALVELLVLDEVLKTLYQGEDLIHAPPALPSPSLLFLFLLLEEWTHPIDEDARTFDRKWLAVGNTLTQD